MATNVIDRAPGESNEEFRHRYERQWQEVYRGSGPTIFKADAADRIIVETVQDGDGWMIQTTWTKFASDDEGLDTRI